MRNQRLPKRTNNSVFKVLLIALAVMAVVVSYLAIGNQWGIPRGASSAAAMSNPVLSQRAPSPCDAMGPTLEGEGVNFFSDELRNSEVLAGYCMFSGLATNAHGNLLLVNAVPGTVFGVEYERTLSDGEKTYAVGFFAGDNISLDPVPGNGGTFVGATVYAVFMFIPAYGAAKTQPAYLVETVMAADRHIDYVFADMHTPGFEPACQFQTPQQALNTYRFCMK